MNRQKKGREGIEERVREGEEERGKEKEEREQREVVNESKVKGVSGDRKKQWTCDMQVVCIM